MSQESEVLDAILMTVSQNFTRAVLEVKKGASGEYLGWRVGAGKAALDDLRKRLKVLFQGFDAEVDQMAKMLAEDVCYKAPEFVNLPDRFFAFRTRLLEEKPVIQVSVKKAPAQQLVLDHHRTDQGPGPWFVREDTAQQLAADEAAGEMLGDTSDPQS